MSYVVAALYHFFDFPHFAEMRQPLLETLTDLSIKGTLLVAPEGINGTVAGSRESIDQLLSHLKKDIIHGEFTHKESLSETQPFIRPKVRLKKETISLGEPVSLHHRGTYVTPQEWNALMADPDTIIIDTRNDYEVHLGTFEGAENPQTRNFKQLPAYARKRLDNHKQAKIATFCTGGIRCEKFTAWLVEQGYENVYHLQGGILKYLEEIPAAESKWQGECFVFDQRIAVGHALTPSVTASMCTACGHPLTPEDRAQPIYREAESCPHCTYHSPRSKKHEASL